MCVLLVGKIGDQRNWGSKVWKPLQQSIYEDIITNPLISIKLKENIK